MATLLVVALISEKSHLFQNPTASTDQGRPRRRVVRLAKRTLWPMSERCEATHRLDGRHLQRLVFFQGRQQAGQAAGEQGLAGAGRAAEQQVVGAGRGDQQGALGSQLTLDFAEVGVGRVVERQALGRAWRDRCLPIEMSHRFQQVVHRNHRQARGQAGFLGVGPGHQQAVPGIACRQRGRQYTTYRAHGAGQGQFPEAFDVVQRLCRQLPARGEDAQGDRQVEAPAIFGQVSGCQVEGDASGGKSNPALRIALRTRSLLSLTAVSGRPTRVRLGRPLARCTSTLTAGACTPTWARLWMMARDMRRSSLQRREPRPAVLQG